MCIFKTKTQKNGHQRQVTRNFLIERRRELNWTDWTARSAGVGAQHEGTCLANHTGSAGKVVGDGVIEMFRQSLDLHDVIYGEYIGDARNKTFPNLVEVEPCGHDFVIHKLECILHVGQKNV